MTDREKMVLLDGIPLTADERLGLMLSITAAYERGRADMREEACGWQDIATAPKNGSALLLAKYGWLWDTGDAEFGSSLWRERAFGGGGAERKYELWWIVKGHWSSQWNNWNDGIEPSGLAGPTHWRPLPDPPAAIRAITVEEDA